MRAADSYALDHDGVQGLLRGSLGLLHLVGLAETSFSTVRMVPSTGLRTALNATFTPFLVRTRCRGRGVGTLRGGKPLHATPRRSARDDAGVAAGAHEGAVRDRPSRCRTWRHRSGATRSRPRRCRGEGHVRSSVPVGNREDVELVDLVRLVGDDLHRDREAGSDSVGNHDTDDLEFLLGAMARALGARAHSSMCTRTSTSSSSAIFLRMNLTELARLSETELMLMPCSTMTCRSMMTAPATLARDVDSLAQPVRGQQAGDALLLVRHGHAHDAVASGNRTSPARSAMQSFDTLRVPGTTFAM